MFHGDHLLSNPSRRLEACCHGARCSHGGTGIERGRTCAGESASAAHAPSLLLDGDEDNRDDQPYDSFKIISRKALSDYKKAERIFLDFLAAADVWSQDEVRLCQPSASSAVCLGSLAALLAW